MLLPNLLRSFAVILAIMVVGMLTRAILLPRGEKLRKALAISLTVLLASKAAEMAHMWNRPIAWYEAPLTIVATIIIIVYAGRHDV